MRNIFIIVMVVVALGYMVSIMFNKYETIKETNQQIEKQK